jgi:hypothetical protein
MINCFATAYTLDTPHKKIKPNEEAIPECSTEHSVPKGSFLSRLREGSLKSRRPARLASVSEFTVTQEYRSSFESEKAKVIE